jgi:hypothetical protein
LQEPQFWRILGNPGDYWSFLGNPGRILEDFLENFGEFWRIQDFFWRILEVTGILGMFSELSGGFWIILEFFFGL